jgi:glycosyltransferase involved in cell wall biosynthesis
MAKTIVLVSSGQPSLNPRLVKEADALTDAGYEVTVLFSYWNTWGTEFDKQLLPAKKWKAVCVGGDPEHNRVTYFMSRLIYKLAQSINSKKSGAMIEFAIARASYFLISAAKKHQADLYIGHNLGALPAVVAAAKANNKPCGFDAEDFHRNETSDDSNTADVILKTNIENKYLPRLNYFTASSPQIANAYRQLYPALKPVVLLNVFPKSIVQINASRAASPLKLFWFSQTIGADRGLDDIINALLLLPKHQFELHLLGSTANSSKTFINQLLHSNVNINLHLPVAPDQVIAFASQFDIGLALENNKPINRDICLTNKIFTYMQAGLAIIASDTTAQQHFINNNPQIGSTYPKHNAQQLATIISNYYTDQTRLLACKENALQLAHQQYNWEVESLKFLDTVKQTLIA